MHRVFVYGTLKRGERNHRLMATAHIVGDAVTRDAIFSMGEYDSYTFPGRTTPDVSAGGTLRIAGELYEVDDALLAELDAFERVGVEYTREAIILADGAPAFMYLHKPLDRRPPRDGILLQVHVERGIAHWSDPPT